MRPIFMIIPMLPLTACMVTPPGRLAAPAPSFSAQEFFAGRTEGEGALKTMLSSRHTVRVHGIGHVDPDGTMILDQTVEEQGKSPKQREWRIRTVAAGRYSGTLTDAVGPIAGEVSGNRLHLRFRTKGGFDVQQWLDLAPGGRSARNHMIVRKFGIVVAAVVPRGVV
jgi:hypothetical protein